ncbi:hypothetical protein WICPIJ_010059 [Wickerhamomyces pijperi]|uniref:Palmitoyltransferase n=1 Tax=Wickerhamomyces pijperi TaxID=599730 RepID=A0A9P8PJD0_WICPI|nr:hypothetical protein WICPIJ_010059 [Wickerhamomyces pijperi]
MNIFLNFQLFINNASLIFPRTLVNAIYAYSLYCIGFVICLGTLGESSVGPLLFWITLGLYLHGVVTYYRVIKIGPGFTSSHSNLLRLTEDNQAPDFLINNGTQELHICKKCDLYKPPRAHHCSSCNACVLKMDHHCPWFALCIGSQNYKLFIQFLLMSLIFAVWSCAISGWYVWRFIAEESYTDEYMDLNVIINGVIALSMSVSLAVFDGVEMYFLLKGMTTIEYYEKSDFNRDVDVFSGSMMSSKEEEDSLKWRNIFDTGSVRDNWEVVMGTTLWEWLLPVQRSTLGDIHRDEGLSFPVNKENLKIMRRNEQRLRHNNQHSDNVRSRLLGQLSSRSD